MTDGTIQTALEAVRELRALLPERTEPFAGSQVQFPVCQAMLGGPPDVARLAQRLERFGAGDEEVKTILAAALCAAEAIESARADRAQWFVRDDALRKHVFNVKWRAGWILLVGGGDQAAYERAFRDAVFLTFATSPAAAESVPLGERETAIAYFAQMLARYALFHGEIEAGDLHELSHFVEDHGPAAVVMTGPLRPVEGLLVLALMWLGVPAVVTTDFPYQLGRRAIATSPAEALQAVGQFENMRVRAQENAEIALPECANPAAAREQFEAARRIGGADFDFLVVRQGEVGEPGAFAEGALGDHLGIVVTADNLELSQAASAALERRCAGYLNWLRGVRCAGLAPLRIELSADCKLGAAEMADIVWRGLALTFPRLGRVRVEAITDAAGLSELAPDIAEYRPRRDEAVAALTEDSRPFYVACEACAAFAREHVCWVGPERNPMCGRDWMDIELGARFMEVSEGRPWRHRGVSEQGCHVVEKGACLDAARGEYAGLNQFVAQQTGGRMKRVFLHSVREFPHSNCGCFHNLAWWSEALGGLAIMHRGFTGAAPDGETWETLANRAGGKQAPGLTGIGPLYLRSPKFLQGDGGWRAVKWMTRKLKDELTAEGVIPEGLEIATE